MDNAVAKGMANPPKTSAYPARGTTVHMHMAYLPVTRFKSDINVLSRKVVRDSIHGISRSQFGPGTMLMANDFHYHSEGGYSVCTVFSAVLLQRANNPSQTPGTERRHQADFRVYLRRGTPSNGRSVEDGSSSFSNG